MNKNNYIPSPINVDDVVIPSELEELLESIARNVHEVWAFGRMKEGWTYGPERDDQLKKHPDLKPYEKLSEIEKQYDRETAMNTIRLVIKLGYNLVKK